MKKPIVMLSLFILGLISCKKDRVCEYIKIIWSSFYLRRPCLLQGRFFLPIFALHLFHYPDQWLYWLKRNKQYWYNVNRYLQRWIRWSRIQEHTATLKILFSDLSWCPQVSVQLKMWRGIGIPYLPAPIYFLFA